jgi:uroporphyrinogen-III synthase
MERGATIEYAECYRRVRPSGDASVLLKAWARGEIDAITVTSAESLRNLFDMIGILGRPFLRKTPLFVPHQRIAELARELGIATVVVTASGDAEMLEGIIRYFCGPHPSQ